MKMVKRFLLAVLLFLPGLLPAADPINVNTATKSEFMALHGIGPVKAEAIIAARTAGGPFGSLRELADRVKGVGDKFIEANSDKLTVE
uniref:Competence protein ComEA n=1 Tax=Candidatus Kentrum eta TaxID=2126337 RepID=A0A450UNW5_9GAMM|nr:MAG: competence protein ComEA [Candidatus Kentron sp. H]VFJ94989.1 MAG: competence protein ComEA [Candidatus Kentron sp. H]VFK01471.1 MAG: competence protein ComEA [Candidatus Kentron sp. H]